MEVRLALPREPEAPLKMYVSKAEALEAVGLRE
jgi:hypothetical protein